MKTDKERYNDLYNEYKILVEKTTLTAKNLQPGGVIETQNISADDLQKRIDVEGELLKGLSFLSDDQLIILSADDFFGKKAEIILTERKMSN